MELFRQEAVQHQQQRLLGEVALVPPAMSWQFALLLTSLFAAIVLALALGDYARKESVLGWLTPDKGLIRVYATDLGSVETVHVAVGDSVEAGAPLLTISRDTDLKAGGAFSARVLAELSREELELRSRLAVTAKRYALEIEAVGRQCANLLREQRSIARQIETHTARIELAQRLAEQLEQLVSKGFVSELERLNRLEALMAQRLTGEQLVQKRLQLATEIGSLEDRLNELPLEEAERLSEIRTLLAANAQRRSDALRQAHIVVRSPVAGRVAAVPVYAGQTLVPPALQVALLPRGAELWVELFAPTRAAGFIQPGQAVRLLYDAFPFQKFGAGNGEVAGISSAALSHSDLSVDLGIREPVYRVSVQIHEHEVEAYGGQLPLQAGMTLRADIILEKRKLWEFLFDPLLTTLRR